LKGIVQKATPGNTAAALPAEDQTASLAKMYAARVEQLKQWLEANPSEKIPELKNMTDDDWLNAVTDLNTDEATDDDFKRAMRIVRANAEGQVLGTMWRALRNYAPDNNGQFPTDLSQLAPYFKSPIDDAILRRYEIVPTSSLVPELQTAGDWAITQVSAVNPDLDIRSAYGLTNMFSAGETISNRWTLSH
jgi:hypothetical protein